MNTQSDSKNELGRVLEKIQDYESVEDFEQKNDVQLPENIKAMLTQR